MTGPIISSAMKERLGSKEKFLEDPNALKIWPVNKSNE
jgi:hypothetical protein